MTSTTSTTTTSSLWRWSLVLAAAMGSACTPKPPKQVTPSVIITQPTNNQVITPLNDEDPNTPGIQFSIKANVTGLNTGSNAALLIDGVPQTGQNAPRQVTTTTSGAGTVTFSKVTLASGTESISVKVTDKVSAATAADTKTVTVQSAAGCQFTSPVSGATLTHRPPGARVIAAWVGIKTV